MNTSVLSHVVIVMTATHNLQAMLDRAEKPAVGNRAILHRLAALAEWIFDCIEADAQLALTGASCCHADYLEINQCWTRTDSEQALI